MQNTIFWIIRYIVLSISLVCAATAIIYIIKKKLYNRVLMVFVAIAAGCQGIMAFISLLFVEAFIDVDQPSKLNQQDPWRILSQLQGYVFRSAQLSSFAITTAMTLIIYYVISDQIDRFNLQKNKIMLASFVIPLVILLPTIFYEGNGPCFEGDTYFNCACPNPSHPYFYYVLNWMIPCILLTAVTVWLIILIEKYRNIQKMSGMRNQQLLAMKAYWIPVSNFIFLIFNLILDSTGSDFHQTSSVQTIIVIINLLVFFMPVVNFIAIIRYKTLLDELMLRPSQLSRTNTGSLDLQKKLIVQQEN